jgi:hypothetical protein
LLANVHRAERAGEAVIQEWAQEPGSERFPPVLEEREPE